MRHEESARPGHGPDELLEIVELDETVEVEVQRRATRILDRPTGSGQTQLQGEEVVQVEIPVAVEGQDELAELARHMGVMAKRLAQHQKALLEARELSAIGEVCGNIAHGLRNPLASIRTCVQLAQREAQVSEPLGKALSRLLAQADRMDERIARMFEFSKPLDLIREPVTFGSLALLARADAQPLLHDASVDLEILDHTGQTSWLVDSGQIGCVLAELITNAAHHCKPGASITVVGTVIPPHNGSSELLCIQVIDQGTGMPPATLNNVFDLFFTSRPDGTGVGLALADRIIRKHDGAIRIESTLGSGTTVTITLPGGSTGQGARCHDASEVH